MTTLLAPALLAVCLFILQGTLLSGLQLDLITPLVVYVALESNLAAALLFAIGLGFLTDTMSGAVAGLNIALNLGVLAIARLVRDHLMLGSLLVRVGVASVGLVTRSVLYMILTALLLGWAPTGGTAVAMAVQVVGGTLISLPMFALLDLALESFSLRQQSL